MKQRENETERENEGAYRNRMKRGIMRESRGEITFSRGLFDIKLLHRICLLIKSVFGEIWAYHISLARGV